MKKERKMVIISKRDLKKLSALFSLYGQKTAFETETKVSRTTVGRVIKAGQGEERVVKLLLEYCEKQEK